ncbi:peptidoglycan-binding protein [Streptomyces sp. NPDC004457]|uniref:peptidoglycan-binding protein n=1 Tax=Streptomyces spinosus TaxID=2872623 RepID=UPI001CED831E|nr:peptidoglycan-binding domain-containing protein [Streptomyces spinosus]
MPTPPDPEQPPPGPALEPVRVVRLRRFDALAELMRDIRPPGVVTDEDATRELPPVPAPVSRPPGVPGAGPRRAAVAVAVVAAALVGFGCALLLTGRQQAAATARPAPAVTTAPPATAPGGPPASAPAPTAPAGPPAPATATDPDGPGTLRQGDTGPEVTDLQRRLLRVPDVYRDGSTSGTYDTTLAEAVARFQLWYGVSGDERGVYGNDTRRALESRTGSGDDS